MSGGYMFSEFIGMISDVFRLVFVSKYSWLFIAIFVSFAGSAVVYLVRWFNRA